MEQFLKSKTVFQMELRRFLQNRKLMLTTFLFIPIMIVLLICAITYIGSSHAQSHIDIYGADQLPFQIQSDQTIQYQEDLANLEQRIRTDSNNVALIIKEDTIQIVYDSSLLSDISILHEAQRIAGSVLAHRINSEHAAVYEEAVSTISLTDTGTACDHIRMTLIPIISTLLMICLMMTYTDIGALCADSIAGERERGTFDTLRLCGARIPTIVISKYLFVVLIQTLMLILESVFIALGLQLFQSHLFRHIISHVASRPFWFMPILVSILSVSMLSSALYIAIASSFEKVRQVSAYAAIAHVILSLFSYTHSIWDKDVLNYLPIGNLSTVIHSAIENHPAAAYAVTGLGISIVIAIAALTYSTIILEREMKR